MLDVEEETFATVGVHYHMRHGIDIAVRALQVPSGRCEAPMSVCEGVCGLWAAYEGIIAVSMATHGTLCAVGSRAATLFIGDMTKTMVCFF